MDLSFFRFERDHRVTLAQDLALLIVGVAARQAASPTASLHHRLSARRVASRFSPVDGAFSAPVAALLRRSRVAAGAGDGTTCGAAPVPPAGALDRPVPDATSMKAAFTEPL